MEIINVPISLVDLWDKNPRKIDDKAYERLKKQIQKLGFYKPLICFEENGRYISVGGNQRLKALRELGYETVGISLIHPKSESEKVEYALSDNDTAGYYEGDRLLSLIGEVGDIQFEDYNVDVGFSMPVKEVVEVLEVSPVVENVSLSEVITSRETPQRDIMNLNRGNIDRTLNIWGIPVIRKEDIEIDNLVPFSVAKLTQERDGKVVHFFQNDDMFSVVWNKPDKYIDMFRQFKACFSPDFSMYVSMPLAVQLWNVYRNRWCGSYWQDNDIRVIPTISWSDQRSYNFCFLGVERGSDVAVSNLGIGHNREGKDLFVKGFDEMIRRIAPRRVYFYGRRWPELGRYGDLVRFFDVVEYWQRGVKDVERVVRTV